MELALSIISFVASVITIITAVLPIIQNKRKYSIEYDNKYNQLRADVAEALTMYACFYNSPVDLAKLPDKKLPEKYNNASIELRKLGATASALATLVPAKRENQKILEKELLDVSSYLIGLSNSMTTPYNCGASTEDILAARKWEAEIKKLLSIN